MDGARGRRGRSAIINYRESLNFKDETKDDAINNFISEPTQVNKEVCQILNITLVKEEEENLTEEALVGDTHIIPVLKN